MHSDNSCHNAFAGSLETVRMKKGILKEQHFFWALSIGFGASENGAAIPQVNYKRD